MDSKDVPGFRLNLDPDSWAIWLYRITQPNTYEESCAWLFCDKPFNDNHVVFVFPVKNVGRPGDTPFSSFAPDKREFQRIKHFAKKKKLSKIGNVHTHVLISSYVADEEGLEDIPVFDPADDLKKELYDLGLPSHGDLQYARRFNNFLRGIVTVLFAKLGGYGLVVSVVWHDQFGAILSRNVRGHIEEAWNGES